MLYACPQGAHGAGTPSQARQRMPPAGTVNNAPTQPPSPTPCATTSTVSTFDERVAASLPPPPPVRNDHPMPFWRFVSPVVSALYVDFAQAGA